jgi:putative flippase GtrA
MTASAQMPDVISNETSGLALVYSMPSPPIEDPSRSRALQARALLVWEHAPRFVRNAATSLPTFLLDLGLLFLLVRFARMDYLLATIASFVVANGLGYFMSRWLVFGETTRGVRIGLVYFLAIAAVSAFALTPLMWVGVSLLHIDVVVSRIIASVVVGVGSYLANLTFNFRVARPAS